MTSTLDMMSSLQFSATQEANMDAAVAEAMKNVKSPEDAAKVMARMMSMMTQGGNVCCLLLLLLTSFELF